MKVILGIGCDRGTPLATLEQAIDASLASVGLAAQAVEGLASIDLKSDEPALLALSRRRNWPITFYPAKMLANVPVPNPSEVVRRHVGTPAVSEAAALLAAGVGMERLLVEKWKHKGADGKNATVSVARMEHHDGQ